MGARERYGCMHEGVGGCSAQRSRPGVSSPVRARGARKYSWSIAAAAAARNENRCYRSPTRSAMAQMARHPSVHMTDITPAHTAATLRPDRHHTHGHQVAILGWRLASTYEAYRLRYSFLSRHSSPWACRWKAEVLGVRPAAGSSVGMARKSCGRAKSKRSCLCFPTSPTGEGG